jgi:hypothetical protein
LSIAHNEHANKQEQTKEQNQENNEIIYIYEYLCNNIGWWKLTCVRFTSITSEKNSEV